MSVIDTLMIVRDVTPRVETRFSASNSRNVCFVQTKVSIDHITSLAVEECGMAVIPKSAVLAVVRGMILAHSFPVAETAHGTRVLRTDIWQQLPVVFPPVTEQCLVIDHIDSISNKYDKLASRTQRSIDLLKERRSALITAAVTGQIDLRDPV